MDSEEWRKKLSVEEEEEEERESKIEEESDRSSGSGSECCCFEEHTHAHAPPINLQPAAEKKLHHLSTTLLLSMAFWKATFL